MRRVLVIGSAGAGKSTFARRLGERTGLPVIHIDQLFWLPGWAIAPTELFRQRLGEALSGDRWIIDGNYCGTLDWRLTRADAVILMQRSRVLCLARALTRMASSYGRTRADMPPGCPERFDLEFMRLIWNFPKRSEAKVRDALTRHGMWDRTTTLGSDRDADDFLARVAPVGA